MPKINKASHFQILPKMPTVPPMPDPNPSIQPMTEKEYIEFCKKEKRDLFLLGNYKRTEPCHSFDASPIVLVKCLKFWQDQLRAADLNKHGEFEIEYDHTDEVKKIQEVIEILQKLGGD